VQIWKARGYKGKHNALCGPLIFVFLPTWKTPGHIYFSSSLVNNPRPRPIFHGKWGQSSWHDTWLHFAERSCMIRPESSSNWNWKGWRNLQNGNRTATFPPPAAFISDNFILSNFATCLVFNLNKGIVPLRLAIGFRDPTLAIKERYEWTLPLVWVI